MNLFDLEGLNGWADIDLPEALLLAFKSEETLLLISLSGGKDSYAMLSEVHRVSTKQEWKCQILCVHAHLGQAEWAGTEQIIQAQVSDFGLPLKIVRHTEDERGLLKTIWDRWSVVKVQGIPPWTSAKARYCTSYEKRDPIDKLIRSSSQKLVINAMGLRAQESYSRVKKNFQ